MRRSRTLPSSALALAWAVMAACGDGEPRPGAEPVALPSPAGAGSGEPFLSVDDEERVHLSWLEPDSGDTHALRFAVLEGGAWSVPRTIARSGDFFVNWADFPSVVPLPGGRLVAHWLHRSGPGTYAYDVRLSWSDDGGASWSAPLVPHRDSTETEHGFVSLFPEDGGAFGVVWLDGRQYAGASHGEGEGEMTLRYARVAPGADGAMALADERVLDRRTCDCCQTTVARAADGPVVLYRDRSAQEVRDIAFVRRTAAGWSAERPLHEDGWVIPACPVNGPAADAAGERVVVAWFTAAADTPRVRVAFSGDAGATFGAPARVDEGTPEGRVDVRLLPDGSAAVVWLERTGDGAQVRVRRIAPSGEAGPARVVARSSAARASGFPRMVLAGERLVFAWTQPGEPAGVRVAALPLEAL